MHTNVLWITGKKAAPEVKPIKKLDNQETNSSQIPPVVEKEQTKPVVQENEKTKTDTIDLASIKSKLLVKYGVLQTQHLTRSPKLEASYTFSKTMTAKGTDREVLSITSIATGQVVMDIGIYTA